MEPHNRRFAARVTFDTSLLIAFASVSIVLVPLAPTVTVSLAKTMGPEIPAEELVRRVIEGEDVELTGNTIAGDLDFRPIQTLSRPFRCMRCTFTGSIHASHVVFKRIVDLSGSRIEGSLVFEGASFEDAFLLRAAQKHPADIYGDATFELVTFGKAATFDEARFGKSAIFTGARFLGDTSFADAEFEREAGFERASFGGNALFTASSTADSIRGPPPDPSDDCPGPPYYAFAGPANFTRAIFRGNVDFRHRIFRRDANFEGSALEGPGDFAFVRFKDKARFDNTTFKERVSFASTKFCGPASFEGVMAMGLLTFRGAEFSKRISLFGLTASSSLSLEDIFIEKGQQIVLARLSAADLRMEPKSVNRVGGPRDQVETYRLIEESARRQGDLLVANDARFELLSLANQQSEGVKHWTDQIFYKTIAGYLVRPMYPLRAFLVLLIIGSAVRTVLRWKRSRLLLGSTTLENQPEAGRGLHRKALRGSMGRAGGALSTAGVRVGVIFSRSLATTTRAAFAKGPGKGPSENEEQLRPYLVAGLRWGEHLVFKLLLVLFVLSLANSNSTLREIIDSLGR